MPVHALLPFQRALSGSEAFEVRQLDGNEGGASRGQADQAGRLAL